MWDNIRLPDGVALHAVPQGSQPFAEVCRLGAGHIAVTEDANQLTFAMALSVTCSSQEMLCLPHMATAALCRAVGGKTKIHWPCNIIQGDDTIGSVRAGLIEGGIAFLFTLSGGEQPDAISIVEAVAEDVAALVRDYPQNHPERMEGYCNLCVTIMTHVDVVYRGMPLYGFAFAVDKHGSLMVMTQPGKTVVTITSGPVTIADKDDPGDEIDLPNPAKL